MSSDPLVVEEFRSTIAQSWFHVEGKPFSLENYPMYYAIYDGAYPKLLLKTSRQIGKSTTVSNFMIGACIGAPHFKCYYVSPSAEQTRKFSHTRVAKVLNYSPGLKQFVNKNEIDNVLLRMFANGSEMAFTYALDNADRARGFSADQTAFDEIQEMAYESVVPIVEECFDSRAEVLTRQGWKLTKDLTLSDEVADVNAAGSLEWNPPTNLIQRQYTGTMIRFTHMGVDLRVTSNHVMWANFHFEKKSRKPDVYQFITAQKLFDANYEGFKMTGVIRPVLTTPITRHFDGLEDGHGPNRTGVDIPYLAFARLVGWYLAEGSLRYVKRGNKKICFRPCITQHVGRGFDDIISTIDACGLTYMVSRNSKNSPVTHITVNSRLLGEYFQQYGSGAHSKSIPPEFFDHPAALEQLLEGLYLGDATKRENCSWDKWTLFTTSIRLADDVHRAWVILGRSPRLRTARKRDCVGYEVCAYIDSPFRFVKRDRRLKEEQVENEPVFCFTVKNHRPIVRGGFGQRPLITSQCMGNSKYAYSIYAGTPKTMENTIEFLWSRSSQSEWCMRCDACGKSTFIASTKALGLNGPECLACRAPLNPRKGRWIDMSPGATIKGFHISQPMMPENVPAAWRLGSDIEKAQIRWERILNKMETYGESNFLNEVIGVSTSTGARLLTLELLKELCDSEHALARLPGPDAKVNITRTVAGVDWSGGGGEVKGTEGLVKSRTVLHIWGETGDDEPQLKTLYYKIFPNSHPSGWIDEIAELCNAWGVDLICGDAGEGALANSMLRERLGARRVMQARYMALSRPLQWNPDTQTYHVDRTTMIDNYAKFLTDHRVIFARESESMPAINDMLNVYEEVTTQGRKVWRHAPTQPDDALHAQLFGWLAWRVLCQDMTFYA